ncbi:MAG: SurA N-terminal domain-containing protein [Gammaproteobacteria bacterium]|nr:SurA N-terminal domain-containing protein [Gammaproteobacteria bacterium]
MLQQIRDHSRGVFGWIILGAIVIVLTLFGFGAFTAFVSGEPTVAKIGKAEVTRAELEQGIDRQRRQMLAQMGSDVDPSLLDDEFLADRVLANLVQRTLLLEGARSARMVVSEREIDRMIVGMEEFRSEGRFDPERFRFVLASAGMTPPGFRRALSEDLLIEQLAGGLGDTSFTTERELSDMAALLLQQRDAAWLRFEPEYFEAEVELDDGLLRDFYERHLDEYFAEETVVVRYVMLERAALVDDVEVTEAALRGAYEREMEAFEGQERRRASHILINTGPARSEADALAKAEDLRQRIAAGEDFADLAREFSDDPGSAPDGGDLGMAGRETFVPPFERALFGLEAVGEISAPVVTQFGVHLIRLDEIASAEPPSFERRRPALLARLKEEGSRERFVELRQELDTLAFETPDLEEPAETLGLEIREAGPFTRSGGEGLFTNRELIRAAFSSEVLDEGYNSSAIDTDDGVVVVLRVAERERARQRDFDEVAEDVRRDYLAVESRRLAREAGDAAVARLQEGARTATVAGLHGLDWQRQDGLTRNDPSVPGRVREQVFALPHPAVDDRSVGSVELADGSRVVVVVTDVRAGDPTALGSAEREQLLNLLRNNLGEQEFESYRQALRRDLGVTIQRGSG